MAVSQDRLVDFEALGANGMKRWLNVATEKYFRADPEDRDSWAFQPFGLFIGAHDSVASDIEAIYSDLSPEGKDDFKNALVSVLGDLPPDPENAEIWQFLVELAWLLPAPEVIKVMEWRFTDDFFDSLYAENDDLFDKLFLFVIGTAVTGPEAERCVSRLVASPRFDFHRSRNALLRLCEIAPGNWTDHFALTRDKLHDLFCHFSLDEAEQAQDELAVDIRSVIGFQRFWEDIVNLLFLRDVDSQAQDTWLWRALVERTGNVLVREIRGKWQIAPAERPSDWRRIPDQITVSNPPSVDHEIKPTDNADRDEEDSAHMSPLAEKYLAPSRLAPSRDEEKEAA